VTRTGGGAWQLYIQRRGSTEASALLSVPSTAPLTLDALSDTWLLWHAGDSAGSSAWSLQAASLTTPGAPTVLLSCASAGDVVLGGLWLRDNTVLMATETRGGDALVARYDLVAGMLPAAQVLTRAANLSHYLSAPSAAGARDFWADMSAEPSGTLQSALWVRDAAGHAQLMPMPGNVFAPQVTGNSLLWVAGTPSAALDALYAAGMARTATATASALAQMVGPLEARDLSGAHARQLAPRVAADSLQATGSVALWSDGQAWHSFDVARNATPAVDSQLRGAGFASANAQTLTWGQVDATTVNVYDVP
jgi:hypothetical protein